MPKRYNLLVAMPQDMYETIQALANKNGNSMASVVRQMISMYMHNIQIASEIVKDTEKLEHIMKMMGAVKDE